MTDKIREAPSTKGGSVKKIKYICKGCGEDRPCILETNQEDSQFRYMELEELTCVLDETNQTSYNWDYYSEPATHETIEQWEARTEEECPLCYGMGYENDYSDPDGPSREPCAACEGTGAITHWEGKKEEK